MKMVYCPVCRQKVNYDMKTEIIKEFRGYTVNVEQNIGICQSCGEEVFVEELENENTQKLYNTYRKVAGTVIPEEIIQFRNNYNISQRELVAILGWGKMTINRYERGALPNKSHNDFLKLMFANDEIFQEKVEEAFKEDRINDKVYKKVKKCFNDNDKNLFRLLLIKSLSHNPNIYNGYKKFDIEKLENLISYIADKTNNLSLTSLNKYLFFIDFENFRRYVKSITGLTYIKYTHGPVIEDFKYYEIVNNLRNKFYKEEFEFNNGIETKIYSHKNYDLSIFREEEMEVINDVINKLKDKTCREISDLSHREDAWLQNKDREYISYQLANNLKLFLNSNPVT